MSVFMDMIVDMLPAHSPLQKTDNQVRTVLDKTMGEYMDNFDTPFDELFLDTATGGWLDAFGKDYNIPRKLDESDDDYRQRIVYEKKDNLTVGLLYQVYEVKLFSKVDNFNPSNNDLTSDNPYIAKEYMGIASDDVEEILNRKFIMDSGVTWL